VTWKYDSNHNDVRWGNYTSNIKAAMADFVKRSGLIQKERLFSDKELIAIRAALAYRLVNDGNLYPDDTAMIHHILLNLECLGELNKDGEAVSC
jgi:hypothetical protein